MIAVSSVLTGRSFVMVAGLCIPAGDGIIFLVTVLISLDLKRPESHDI